MLRLALVGLTLLAATTPVEAQTPAPAPTPAAFVAHAHANVTFAPSPHETLGVKMQFAIAERDPMVRVDLVSLQSSSVPLPPAKLTVVVDRSANTVTLWNDLSKTYYVQAFVPGLPGAPPPAHAPVTGPSRSPLANLEILAFEMHLTGHGTTAGLASSSMETSVEARRKGDNVSTHLTATLALADDFGAFPLAIDATIGQGPATASGPGAGTFGYAVDDFARGVPATISFAVPAGYRQVNSLLEVFLGRTLVRPAGGTPN